MVQETCEDNIVSSAFSDTYTSVQNFRESLPPEIQLALRSASDLKRHRLAKNRATTLPTSIDGFDQLLGGGLERGSLIEIVGRASCGRFAALLAALRAVTGAGETAALVDQGSQLDPQDAERAGVKLDHLLWLRPKRTPASVSAAEMLVHAGFSLVTLDFGLPPVHGRAPLAAWLRLARSCSDHDAIVVIGAPYRLSGCAADIVIDASWGRGRWLGAIGAPRLLEGIHSKLELAKRRGHRPQTSALINLVTPETNVIEIQHEERKNRHAKAL
jgi:hypothetical protein